MSLPWKIRFLLFLYEFIIYISLRPNITVNRLILSVFRLFKTSPSPPSSIDYHLDRSRNLWFRLYKPSSSSSAADSLPILIYFHGGGFATHSPDFSFFNSFAKRLADHVNSVVVSVNYRLAPENRFPAQYDDGFDAVKFLDSPESKKVLPPNADLRKCFIIGDSAGANLGHYVMTRACEFERVRFRGLISVQPFFGGEERTESEVRIWNGAPGLTVDRADWFWKAFLPVGSDRDHPAANVFGPNSMKKLGSDFPNTLVVVGGLDPLLDWQRRYCEGLKKAGIEVRLLEYPNAFHVFYMFPELQESSSMLDEIRDFVTDQRKKG